MAATIRLSRKSGSSCISKIVKAGDATNVDGNAQIEFPNIDNLEIGERRPILSFDHDAGQWIQTGTAIVIPDGNGGTILRSEGDTGVNTLGWKAVGDEDDDCGGAGDAPTACWTRRNARACADFARVDWSPLKWAVFFMFVTFHCFRSPSKSR